MATNIVVLNGRLVKDPDLRTTPSGKSICNFTIAVDRRGKDEGADFIDCSAWEGTGETIAKYLKKGSPILIDGRLRQDTWEKDGKKNSKISIVVNNFQFLSTVKEHTDEGEAPTPEPEIDTGDIPF